MSAPVFWLPDGGDATVGATVTLTGAEGHHAADVRRLRTGEPVELVNGSGLRVHGLVATVSRGSLAVDVIAVSQEPAPSPRLVVVQALPKGNRGELAVELLTEVGVDQIVPWAASRCVVRWQGDRRDHGVQRWRSTAREAAKQSRRAWAPVVAPLKSTADVTRLLDSATLSLVLHESAAGGSRLDMPAGGDVVVVVGPEGGVTDDELARFTAVGALAVRLGPTVLRTSTAGAVAAVALLSRSLRWDCA